MTAQVLTEYLNPASTGSTVVLEEGVDAFGKTAKTLYMDGLFLVGDVRNHNGRIYPKEEIARAVSAMKSKLAEGFSICGEVDHPQGLNINLDRVSHCITDIRVEGSNGMGRLKILPTPMGQLIKALLEANVKLGVSSRGTGDVDPYSGRVSNFEIATVDIVATPSGPGAYPKAIYESLKNFKNGDYIVEGLAENHEFRKLQRGLANDLLQFIKNINKQ